MAERMQTGNELGTAILKALGIPAKGVISVDIGCKAGDMAAVSIVRLVDGAEAGQLPQVLDQYTLEHRPEDPKAAAMEAVARNLLKG